MARPLYRLTRGGKAAPPYASGTKAPTFEMGKPFIYSPDPPPPPVVFAIDPPIISTVTPVTNPPSFNVLLPVSPDPLPVAVGDVVQLRIDGTTVYNSAPLTSTDISNGTITIVNGTLSAGVHTADARITRSSPAGSSNWSNVVSYTIVVPSAAYVYRQLVSDFNSTSTSTTTPNLGTASADRYVLVALGEQNDSAVVSVVANGVSLTQIAAASTPGAEFWGGLVTTGSGTQNVVATWASAAFQYKVTGVWTLTGLASTTPKHTGAVAFGSSSDVSLPVVSGDLAFGYINGQASSPNFNGASVAPAAQRVSTGDTTNGVSADWAIASTATLTFGPPAGLNPMAGITFA